jgi:putative ABC transport system substrate-binding protein
MQFAQLKRRDFITLVGGAAAWPLAARAQQQAARPVIGFLGTDATLWTPFTAAFVRRLRELGWIDGRTIAIEYRWAEGRPERVAEIAAEFVRLKLDAIVTSGDSKRLELLRAVSPRLRRLAVLANIGYPDAVLEMGEVQAMARALGLEVAPLEIRRAEDIALAFEALRAQADALYVVVDALIAANRTRIFTLALSTRLPTIFNQRDFVKAGGLMSYGPNFPDLFRRAAELIDKILRGTKPGDIPVEQPTKFEFVINLTTAKALGLEIPPTLLARADEIIE